MYEWQRERSEKLIETLEQDTQKLQKQCLELENENYALSKGQMPAHDSKYMTHGDGKLSLQLRALETENSKL